MVRLNKPKRKTTTKNNQEKALAQKYVYHTTTWKKLRKLKLINNPLCEECVKNNKVTPAVEVHHITPFMTGLNIQQIQYLGFDYSNLQSLCNDCHQRKHKNM